MRTLTVRLVGTSPLLLHRICRHEFREQIAVRGNCEQSLEDIADSVMVKDAHGNPAVPVGWVWDALARGYAKILVGGKRVKIQRFQSRLTLPAGLLPLQDKDGSAPAMSVFRSVQHIAPGSRKMITVIAPKFKDWELQMRAFVEDSCSNETLMLIFQQAGKGGIGLFHPPKKQFGQFRVSWPSPVT